MNFTDIFVRRPVLASVVSLIILVVGLRSFASLQVLAYPKTENGVVTISTSYPGADPDSIAGFITTPIETAVAQASGIDYMTSVSQSGTSTITVNLRQNYDSQRAASEINIKVNSILNQLPDGRSAAHHHRQSRPDLGRAVCRLSQHHPRDESDHRLSDAGGPAPAAGRAGVQTAEILGSRTFSLRAWLDPQKLAAYGLSASDVSAALAAQRLYFGGGHDQGTDVPDHPDLHQQSAFRG